MKKSSTLVAAAGLALALGAPLVASIPANAAVSSSDYTWASSVQQGVGGHQFSGNELVITESTLAGKRLTVTGETRLPNKDIEIAAGTGWTAAGKTDATGHFSLSIDVANSGGYDIRFGKRVTPTLFGKTYQASWFGTPVS